MRGWQGSNDDGRTRADLAVCAITRLAAFARDVDGATENDAICDALHRHLDELIEIQDCVIYFPKVNDGRLERCGSMLRTGSRAPEAIAPADEHPVAACARERRDITTRATARKADVGSPSGRYLACLPMIVEERILGVLSLWLPSPLDPVETAIVSAFRDYATIASSNLERIRIGSLVRQVIEQSDEAVSFYDRNGRVIFSNPAYHRVFPNYPSREQILGLSHEELYRRDLEERAIDDPVAKCDPARYLAERLRIFREIDREVREIQTIRNRTYLYTRTRAPSGATLSRRADITDMKAAEAELREAKQRLEDLAFTDPLTGLPNRLGFSETAGRVLAHVQRTGAPSALLFLGLDHFKDVNDALGHGFGDALLIAVGKRLRAYVETGDVLARVGGDEFAFLRIRPDEPYAVQNLAAALMHALRAPFDIDGRRVQIDASIGHAIAPRDGTTVDELLRKADLALDRAKADGGSMSCAFAPEMDAEAHYRRTIALRLRDALARDEFEVLYQPVIDVRTRVVVGVEALLRWRTSNGEEIPPGLFIPIAEDSGLIAAIGEWVIQRVCSDARHWPRSLRIACNVSARQFATGNIVDMVARAMAAHGIAPNRLDLEITESMPLADSQRIRDLLSELRDIGVGVVLDDFGTGYASLSYLRSFPFTKIKIDQVFVRDITTRPDCFAIVSAVAGLGADLGMATTAEGVETAEQLNRLIEAGCTEVQGHLFAAALPLGEALRWIRAEKMAV